MVDLETISNDNLGGLKLLQFAPIWFFSADQVFNAGYSWLTIYCPSETMQYNETTQLDDNGNYQTITITGELPAIRPAIHAALAPYRQSRFIVQCEDMNGNLRLAGTLAQPLALSDTSDTGKGTSDANTYTFSFAGNTTNPALFL
ncbi:hypothetical protein [Mucilaginibacter sp.]